MPWMEDVDNRVKFAVSVSSETVLLQSFVFTLSFEAIIVCNSILSDAWMLIL